MLILVPPSEGKAPVARRGRPLDLDALSLPELTRARRAVLAAVISACARPDAARLLGVGAGLQDDVRRNVELTRLPARPALEVYTGVLFAALGYAELSGTGRRRANVALRVQSALWGPIGPGDKIPPYRLSMGATLPGIGPLAAFWRGSITRIAPQPDPQLIVDCRSSSYATAWRGDREQAARTIGVRVLTELDGRLQVVSHEAKRTRGLVARHLLEADRLPRSPQQVAETVSANHRCVLVAERLGWRLDVISDSAGRRGGDGYGDVAG